MRRALIRIAIVTVSDRSARGERDDASGPALAAAVKDYGGVVVERAVVPDSRREIEALLARLADSGRIDILLTTGGTGVAERDVTPEATLAAVERRVPGLAEAMRAKGLAVTPHAMLSRAEAGVRGKCLIVNLPGSPRGAVECFGVIAPALGHAVALLHGETPDG